MKKLLALLVAALLIVCASLALAEPVAIKALILPKFESGEMAGDFPGEAQYYYEGYCEGGESYDIVGCPNPLYVKDGVALCVTGMGKVNSAMTLQAILMDDRFDFSNAYIISTGCAGSAIEYGVMGDVFVITATVDFDLGHHADPRELADANGTTWYHDASYDSGAVRQGLQPRQGRQDRDHREDPRFHGGCLRQRRVGDPRSDGSARHDRYRRQLLEGRA